MKRFAPVRSLVKFFRVTILALGSAVEEEAGGVDFERDELALVTKRVVFTKSFSGTTSGVVAREMKLPGEDIIIFRERNLVVG